MTINLTLKTPKVLLVVIFLVSLCVVGNVAFGLASNGKGPLQIQQGRVTGTVTQIPLHIILEQLHEQLGIEYTAPKEELEKHVSVELQQESLEQALAKILASWDYALKIDPAGKVQQIFVVRKIPAGGQEEKAFNVEDARTDFSNDSEEGHRTRKFMRKQQGVLRDESSVASRIFGASPPFMQPVSPQQDERELWDAMEEDKMGTIPPIGYPEMEVNQVSEKEQQAILHSLNPQTSGSFEGAAFPEMNISPVSEETAQEILRSFNLSIEHSR